jgi:hypothetical protein
MRARVAHIGVVLCCLGVMAAGGNTMGAPSEREAGEPIFMRWLNPDDPQDQTIRYYWDLAQQDKLTPFELVDLGTMLFERGWPKDAVRVYRDALREDPRLYEAWFRIGLVKQRERDVDAARGAYKRCLKLLTGHGWCNFYLGLLEEQTGHASRALHYFERAYKFAPELADPAVNPEVLSSKLQLGALIRHSEGEEFTQAAPMSYLEPKKVAAVEQRFTKQDQREAHAEAAGAQPTPTAEPAPVPAPSPSPAPAPPPPRPPVTRAVPTPRLPPPTPAASPAEGAKKEVPWGMPEVGNVSGEAHLR